MGVPCHSKRWEDDRLGRRGARLGGLLAATPVVARMAAAAGPTPAEATVIYTGGTVLDVRTGEAQTSSHGCMLAYQVSDPLPRRYHRRASVDEAKLSGPEVHPRWPRSPP